MESTDIWKLFAGLGLFLYGMFLLENSIKEIEGRSFKLFLKKHTKNKLSAILSGTLVTAILQSSSIVNLIVLSFVGAGMLSMRNAMGVALGANIGGTVNSWLVAFIGFKLDVNAYTLPILAICGSGMVIFKNRRKLLTACRLGLGIGLLFLGLDFMKESMESLITNFDFRPYLNQAPIVFVLIGFVITALVQTSSATVVLVLSALFAKVIPIETGVAVVLGAELGTTIKLVIGSIGGIAAKKRVAFGNILFNVVTSAYGFIFLSPIIHFLSEDIGLKDPILILVAFQSFLNITGVILIYFFLDAFTSFLEKQFSESTPTATYYLETCSPELTDTAIEMLEKEVGLFIYRVLELNKEVFEIRSEPEMENEYKKTLSKKIVSENNESYIKKYIVLKQAEGEILSFYSKIADKVINEKEALRLSQLVAALRNAMYSAKGMKDIYEDRKSLSNSANDVKYKTYKLIQVQIKTLYTELQSVLLLENKMVSFDTLAGILLLIKKEYEERMHETIKLAGTSHLKDLDISTLLNLNRELYAASKAIIYAIKDFRLDSESAENFENIPQRSSI